MEGNRITQFIEATRECWKGSQREFWLMLVVWISKGVGAAVHRPGPFTNTIVIIGDDWAAGRGDTPTIGSVPGLAGHLKTQLTNEFKVKQTWRIYNCGQNGSTSTDWLPTSEKQEPQMTLFERVFSNSKYSDAQVVFLLVGSNDALLSPEQTMANIHSICKVLSNMDKTIFVCPIANWGNDKHSDALIEANMRRNEMIVEYTSRKSDHVFAGPRIDAMSYEYRVPRYYTADGQFFCHAGYQKLGKDFADVVVNRLVKIEFNKFMKALKGKAG